MASDPGAAGRKVGQLVGIVLVLLFLFGLLTPLVVIVVRGLWESALR